MFSWIFGSSATNLAWTPHRHSFSFPPMYVTIVLLVGSICRYCQSLGLWESALHIRFASYFALKMRSLALPDRYVSEQSIRLSCFPAVYCSPQCSSKLCFRVLAGLYLSSQLVAVPTLAHQTTSSQLSCCHSSHLWSSSATI